jgi:hypothetical protein
VTCGGRLSGRPPEQRGRSSPLRLLHVRRGPRRARRDASGARTAPVPDRHGDHERCAWGRHRCCAGGFDAPWPRAYRMVILGPDRRRHSLGSARRTSRLRADTAHTHGSPRRPSHPAVPRDTGRPATSSGMASAAGRPDVGIAQPVRGPVVRHLTEGRFCALRDRDLTPRGLFEPGRFGPDRSCRQIDVTPRELYYPAKIWQHRRLIGALKSVIYQRSPVFMCAMRPDGGTENSCQPLASLIGRERDHGKNWLVHDSQG